MIKYKYSIEVESVLAQIDVLYKKRIERLAGCEVVGHGCAIMVSRQQHEAILSDPILKQLSDEKVRILSLAIPETIRLIK